MSEKAFDDFQAKIENEIVDFQLFSDVGINAFKEAIKWFEESVEKYELDKDVKSLDRVEIDAERLISTIEKELELKMGYCTIERTENTEFKKLAEQTKESLLTASDWKTTYSTSEVMKQINGVQNNAKHLLEFLKDLQEKQRNGIIKKVESETASLKKIFSKREAASNSAVIVEKPKVVSIDDKLEEQIEEFRRLQVQYQKGFEMFQIEQKQINDDLKEKIVKLHEANRRLESTQELALTTQPSSSLKQTANHGKYKKTIKHTFEINKCIEQGSTDWVFVGNIPWKAIASFQQKRIAYLKVECGWEDKLIKWYCFAEIEFRGMNQYNMNQFYTVKKTKCFNSRSNYLSFNLSGHEINKTQNGCYEKDTVMIELDINLIGYYNIPTREHLFTSPEYELITAILTQSTPFFSEIEQEEQNSTVLIGGYEWKLLLYNFQSHGVKDRKLYYLGNAFIQYERRDTSERPCPVKVDYKLLRQSNNTTARSEVSLKVLRKKTDSVFLPIGLNCFNEKKEEVITFSIKITVFVRKN